MANWIIHRPNSHCHPAEIRVAEFLRELDDRWTVVWGYFYKDARGHSREGDFLIIGPAGGMLVLEVKSSVPRWFSDTGQWEGETTSPVDQLMDEWSAVRSMVRKQGIRLWVTKALCVPYEVASRDFPIFQGIPRNLLVLRNDLDHWLRTWLGLFEKKVEQPVMPPARDAVLALFGASVKPGDRRSFLDHTEQLFQRQLGTRFALLDQLRENRQLLVRGGTGTGKTWHALEQAYRYASADGGKDVLLLVYNLALTSHLERQVAMRKLDQGRATVMSWEALFTQLAAAGGSPPELPRKSDRAASESYYDFTLPGRVLELSRDPAIIASWPKFDALVMDEGQDHDTSWHPDLQTRPDENGGWWHIYRLLLRNEASAPASIFYDPAQRPPFRDSGRFDVERLAATWSQPARVHLQPAVRYTRPIWTFLQNHRHDAIAALIDGLGRGDHLPEGPEPETHTCDESADVQKIIEEIITRWKRKGLCLPEEVLILHRQSDISRSPLGDKRVLCGRNLREVAETDVPADSIRHTSINKAKGLDARAVIILGLPPFAKANKDAAYNWFMGASRARQLLAVVHSEGSQQPETKTV
jgi:hypothetical protein